MDDESYFSLAGDEYSSNRGYYTDNKTLCPIHVKCKSRLKFPPRVLMWIAISEDGFFCKPFFLEKGNMNGNVYLKKCIKKRLLPFIAQKNPTVFWPDGATAHYKKCVKEFLDDNEISYVAQNQNPPKVPELRPIEQFWSLLKQCVYSNGYRANSKASLITRIKAKLKNVDTAVVQHMMEKVKTKVRSVGDNGIDSII